MAASWVRLGIIACVATGCGLVSGLDQLGVDPSVHGDGGSASSSSGGSSSGTSSSGASSSGASSSGASSGASSSGASSSGDSGCVSSGPEICDDGIDNDCNGLVDCADPACKIGYACVPTPSGWSAVGFSATSRPSCGADTPADVVAARPDGPASCSCPCTPAPNTCSGATYTFAWGPQCGGGTASVVAGTSCGAISATIAAPTMVRLSGPAMPSSCSAGTTTLLNTPVNGRICTPPRYGGGCSSGTVCAAIPQGQQACIAKPGSQACPGGMFPYRTGSAIVSDTRSCGTCSCAPQPCQGSLLLYSGSSCNGQAQDVHAGGQCGPGPENAINAHSYSFTEAPVGCAVSSPATVGGTLTLAGESTVCCSLAN